MLFFLFFFKDLFKADLQIDFSTRHLMPRIFGLFETLTTYVKHLFKPNRSLTLFLCRRANRKI